MCGAEVISVWKGGIDIEEGEQRTIAFLFKKDLLILNNKMGHCHILTYPIHMLLDVFGVTFIREWVTGLASALTRHPRKLPNMKKYGIL